MLDTDEIIGFMKNICQTAENMQIGNAVLIDQLKTVSSLFGMMSDIKEDCSFDALAHGFGAMVATFDRVPPISAVNRPEDKKAIQRVRKSISGTIDGLCQGYEDLISNNPETYMTTMRSIYSTVRELDVVSKHFVSQLPPIQ